MCLSLESLVLWMLGYPDQALRRSQEALTLSRELAHPFSLAHTLSFAAWFHHCYRDWPAVQARAEELTTLATEQDFPLWLTQGAYWQGWLLSEQEQRAEGLAKINQAVTAWQATGAELGLPFYLSGLARAYGKVGQVAEGLSVLAEALARVNRTGERFWEAELYQLKGELSLQSRQVQVSPEQVKARPGKSAGVSPQPPTPTPQAEAEACFLKAIEIARRQSAKSLELRAVMSLGRLWQSQGKKEEAQQMLEEVYGWFTEGFDTTDLQKARVLLEELSNGRRLRSRQKQLS